MLILSVYSTFHSTHTKLARWFRWILVVLKAVSELSLYSVEAGFVQLFLFSLSARNCLFQAILCLEAQNPGISPQQEMLKTLDFARLMLHFFPTQMGEYHLLRYIPV